jgi:uncharacterized membrane protein
MVRSDVQIGSCSTQTVFTIEPNRNLSWRQSKRLFLFLSGCIVLISLYFANLGAWLVLPFTGLEILILGSAIYMQSYRVHRSQVIRVDQAQIEISDSCIPGSLKRFPKAWSRVLQTRDQTGWYPSRLLIGYRNEFIEVGRNLIEDERELLANQLRCVIGGA